MNKVALLAVTLCALAAGLAAQTAQDFTITDVEGKSYQLYPLLDAGKHVLVEVYTWW